MTVTFDSYRTITPYLVVPDADRELGFLKTAFAAVEENSQRGPDGAIAHAEIRIGDSLVMLAQAGAQFPAKNASLYLWVRDVDATYAKALSAGATSESKPEDKPYGHRIAGIADGNGITWWIGSPVAK